MAQTPVVQVRLSGERLAFLDSLPGSRSEAIRYCVDFTLRSQSTPRPIENPPPLPKSLEEAEAQQDAEVAEFVKTQVKQVPPKMTHAQAMRAIKRGLAR